MDRRRNDRTDEEQRLLREAAASGPIPLWRLGNRANQPYFDTYAELTNYHERLFRAEPALNYLGEDKTIYASVHPPPSPCIGRRTWRVVLEQVLCRDGFLELLTCPQDVKHWLSFVLGQGWWVSKRPFAKRHLQLQFSRRARDFFSCGGNDTDLDDDEYLDDFDDTLDDDLNDEDLHGRRAKLLLRSALPHLDKEADLLNLFAVVHPFCRMAGWADRFLDVIDIDRARPRPPGAAGYVPATFAGEYARELLVRREKDEGGVSSTKRRRRRRQARR